MKGGVSSSLGIYRHDKFLHKARNPSPCQPLYCPYCPPCYPPCCPLPTAPPAAAHLITVCRMPVMMRGPLLAPTTSRNCCCCCCCWPPPAVAAAAAAAVAVAAAAGGGASSSAGAMEDRGCLPGAM